MDSRFEYGVTLMNSSGRIKGFLEKPSWGDVFSSQVNTGIYVFEPWVLDYVPPDQHYDFPELIQSLLIREKPVGSYPFHGAWFDIGREDDYARAVEAWTDGDLAGISGD